MIAVDTNLLARLLLQDDAAQYKKVKALFKTRQTFTAPITVMLELVWVLESNDCSADEIASGLTALIGLPNFKPERVDAIREALRRYAEGVGFADALHLALVDDAQKFLTFDKAFVRQGDKLKLRPDVVLV
jgi:predicted nucleic-acid-binding protein